MSDNGTSKPKAVDATAGPQGFPFVAATPSRTMLVFQRGDYNGSPQLVARRLDEGATLHTAASAAPTRDEPLSQLVNEAILGKLPPAGTLPCTPKGKCRDVYRSPDVSPPSAAGPLTVSGALSATTVEGVIAAARPTLTRCFPAQRPTGRLVIAFSIDPRGLVTEMKVGDSAIRDERVTSCLFGAVARLRFGDARGITKVKLPIRY